MRSAIKPEFNEVHIEGQIFMASKPEIDRLTPDPAVNAWFEAAKESIKAAEVTYENALYPTSIFNCQQAIEKLVKVLLLSSGVSDDMKAIGHTPHKTLKEFYEKVGDCSKIERCSSLDKIIENNTDFKSRFKAILPYFGGLINEMNRVKTAPRSFDVVVYYTAVAHNNTVYYQTLLLYLSYLLADTEQNSRYPTPNNSNTGLIKISDHYNEGHIDEIGKTIDLIKNVKAYMENGLWL